jgi:FSR family fosmidomycin resistance protein-like MFS transporter
MDSRPSEREGAAAPARDGRRVLAVACGAHGVLDGFTDVLLLMLPIWQGAFGLSYGEVGFLRTLFSGAMATFQIPAGALAAGGRGPVVLALGTAITGAGFLVMGASGGLLLLTVGLALAGFGASAQHPIASDLVARAYPGPRSRAMLGTYNFAGDVGKIAFPAAIALLLTLVSWRVATMVLGFIGLAAAAAILVMLRAPRRTSDTAARTTAAPATPVDAPSPRRGFPVLMALGMVDSATRSAFLTFLPFLLAGKGADLPTIGVALTLVFAGGAAGKLACGLLGARFGVLRTVLLTEGATAVGIAALLPLTLMPGLALLPLIGVALNGTSSVLYGSVPEYAKSGASARAFGIFYTATIGASACAPLVFGLFGDLFGVPATMLLIAAAVLGTLPLGLAMSLLQRSDRSATPPAR